MEESRIKWWSVESVGCFQAMNAELICIKKYSILIDQLFFCRFPFINSIFGPRHSLCLKFLLQLVTLSALYPTMLSLPLFLSYIGGLTPRSIEQLMDPNGLFLQSFHNKVRLKTALSMVEE